VDVEGVAKALLGERDSVVGGDVEEVDAAVDGAVDGADALIELDVAEDVAQGRGAEADGRDGKAGFAEASVLLSTFLALN
jgi:hypothetical protein